MAALTRRCLVVSDAVCALVSVFAGRPLAHYSYFVTLASVNTTSDCSASHELLRWAVWCLTNSEASAMVWASGYSVPHFSVIKRQTDKLGFVTCNGDRALPTRTPWPSRH
jgi:hypothetical protein